MSPKRRGFLMRDLLILIAIISLAIPAYVFWPVTQRCGDYSRCQIINNLKQVSLATHYVNDVYRRLPPATGTFGGMTGGNRSLSVHLLPYVEQTALYAKLQTQATDPTAAIPPYTATLDFTTTDFVRVQNFAANVRVFTDLGIATAHNAEVAGITPSGNEGWNNAKIPDTFKDGTSTTIMYSTRYANQGTPSSGGNVGCSAYDALIGQDNSAFFGVKTLAAAPTQRTARGWQLAPSIAQVNCQFGAVAHSFGTAGIQVGLADASVRMLTHDLSPATWNAAMQPNDGNKLGPDW